MEEFQLELGARGTRILAPAQAAKRRSFITQAAAILTGHGYGELVLPAMEQSRLYTDKAGPEILGQMYVFPDRGGRELCLRPEGTATVQAIARKHYRTQKDVLFWYECRCYRYERPQAGRYREFSQLGVEWINPSRDPQPELIALAEQLLQLVITPERYVINPLAARGLAYYIDGQGFEVACPELGAQQQVVGGGSYAEGCGFAIGLDRLMLM